MATVVLVHGSWLAAWCWQKVTSQLEARGHRAIAVDLPGHGPDAQRAAEIRFDDYVEAVGGVIQRCEEPPLLVVHSWGGIALSVAEAWPNRLQALVLIAAAVPPSGSPMMRVVEQYDPSFPATLIFSADQRLVSITAEGAREFLFGRTRAQDADAAVARLTPEPVAPFDTPIVTTAERFGRVPRFYVETTADRLVPIALQQAIQARIGCRRVVTLDADHAPFLSAPDALAAGLDDIAVEMSSADATPRERIDRTRDRTYSGRARPADL